MRFRFLLLLAAAAVLAPVVAFADKKTVCSVTVNSPDERDIFRRYLPAEEYDFVELVQRGQPDWLASACRANVRCDVLLISGHFDDGTQFYSDRLDAREYLPVDELERASCSDACGGLFSQLKEVYLFGCNTLNDQALRSATSEVTRSLVRAGYPAMEAERVARMLSEQHADSNRDRMRQIFRDVPVIYGFSSKAPLGATAAGVLDRYFQTGARAEIGSGKPSAKLLNLFAPVSMTAAAGLGPSELQASYRRDVCQFVDDRITQVERLEFVRGLLARPVAEVRMFLDRIEHTVGSVSATERANPEIAKVLRSIAEDQTLAQGFLAFARDADQASTRARMVRLAHDLGWLTEEHQRIELVQMFAQRLAQKAIGPAEVDLACSLQATHGIGAEIDRIALQPPSAARAAVLACLGSDAAHAQVVQALASPDERDVQIAQVVLKHQPVVDVAELRALAAAVARMSTTDAQVRTLDTLARLQVADAETLQELTRLFPLAKTVSVQRAIAGVLIRADHASVAKPELLRALRDYRIKSSEGPDVIDVLIRRLQS